MYSKELIKGTLHTIILNLLAENGRMYGYEIFSRVKELTDDKIVIKDGSLYPALKKLTQLGFLTVEEEKVSGRTRRYYTLTKKGKTKKVESLSEFHDFFKTISNILTPQPVKA